MPLAQGRLWCGACRWCVRRAIHESPLRILTNILPYHKRQPPAPCCSLYPPPAALATGSLKRGASVAVVGKSAIEPGGRFVNRPYGFYRTFFRIGGGNPRPPCCGTQNSSLAFARRILTAATPCCSLYPPAAALATVPLQKKGGVSAVHCRVCARDG